MNFWSETLNLKLTQIVSVTKSKNVRQTKMYGSGRICIDSAVLTEIFLNGIMPWVLSRVINPQNETDKQLLHGFIRGLLAAEGCVYINKHGSLVRVSMAFDPHSKELDLYKTLLERMGISYHTVKGNELIIQKYANMMKLMEIDAFKIHTLRNFKFMSSFRNHKYFKTHYLESDLQQPSALSSSSVDAPLEMQ